MAPPATRRVAATALRSIVAAAARPRASPAARLSAYTYFAARTAAKASPRAAAAPRFSIFTRSALVAAPLRTFTSTAAGSARGLATAASHVSTAGSPYYFSTTAARSNTRRAAGCGVTRYPFKIHSRRSHNEANKTRGIPEEVQKELQRIEADGLQRHQELLDGIKKVTKHVADVPATIEKLKVDFKWHMRNTASRVCSVVLAAASVSGCVVLNFVNIGWGKDDQDAASSLLKVEAEKLREDLETKMDRILEKNEKEDALKIDKKTRSLDEREAAVAAREAAILAKEAAAAAKKTWYFF